MAGHPGFSICTLSVGFQLCGCSSKSPANRQIGFTFCSIRREEMENESFWEGIRKICPTGDAVSPAYDLTAPVERSSARFKITRFRHGAASIPSAAFVRAGLAAVLRSEQKAVLPLPTTSFQNVHVRMVNPHSCEALRDRCGRRGPLSFWRCFIAEPWTAALSFGCHENTR